MKFIEIIILSAVLSLMCTAGTQDDSDNNRDNEDVDLAQTDEPDIDNNKNDDTYSYSDNTDHTETTDERDSQTEYALDSAELEQLKSEVTQTIIAHIKLNMEKYVSEIVDRFDLNDIEDINKHFDEEMTLDTMANILTDIISDDKELLREINLLLANKANELDDVSMNIDKYAIVSQLKDTLIKSLLNSNNNINEEKENGENMKLSEDDVTIDSTQCDNEGLDWLNQQTNIIDTKEEKHQKLTHDDLIYLNNLLLTSSAIDLTSPPPQTFLSYSLEWSLNATAYSNYTLIMLRLWFGDEEVTRNHNLAVIIANFLTDRSIPAAQHFLGYLYSNGLAYTISVDGEIKRDRRVLPQHGLIYYTFAMLGGDVFSEMTLGYKYLKGISVGASCRKALYRYQKVATKIRSQISLSGGPALYKTRLIDGREDSPSHNMINRDMIQYFEMLADKGDATYQLFLGQLYLQGSKGAERNVEMAIKCFKLAAEQEEDQAWSYLGKIYADTKLEGITNFELAHYYLNRGISRHSVSSMAVMGFLYLTGRGVERNIAKAKELLEPGAKKNVADSFLYLGLIYYYGLDGTKNVEKAMRYFMAASESGNLLALNYLAKINADSAGTNIKSCQASVNLYKGVAERGLWTQLLMEAHNSYKMKDYMRALLLYLYLSEMGYEIAQSNAAYILETVEVNPLDGNSFPSARAYQQWFRASEQGLSLARVRLGDYHFYGLGRTVNYELAASEYKMAAKEDNPQAKFNMGYMYENGLGVPKDLPLAKRNYDECMTLEPEAYLAVNLAVAHLFLISNFEWMTSNLSLPLIPSLEKLANQFRMFWDIYLITILVMALGLVFLMYKQHLARNE